MIRRVQFQGVTVVIGLHGAGRLKYRRALRGGKRAQRGEDGESGDKFAKDGRCTFSGWQIEPCGRVAGQLN